MKMPSKKDMHFVQGELAPGRLSLATTGAAGPTEANLSNVLLVKNNRFKQLFGDSRIPQ